MAITFVGSATKSGIDGLDVTIDLTTIAGLAQDDIVVVYGGSYRGTGAGTSSAGWTSTTYNGSGASCRSALMYKIMGAVPDASIVCLGGGNSTNGVAYVALAFRGVNTATPLDATTTFTDHSASATTNPDSPSIVTASANAAVISAALSIVFDTAVTAPTGYGDAAQDAGNDTNPSTVAMAWKTVATPGTEDPASWTNWDSGLWLAITVALKPAGTTVNLTGVSGTSALGTLALAYDSLVQLTGVAGTSALGTLADSIVAALSGLAATGQVGAVALAVDATLTGVAGTTHLGTLVGSIGLQAVAGTGELGTLAQTVEVTVTGVAGTTHIGTIAVINATLDGVEATGAVGTLGLTIGATLTSVLGTGQVGTLTLRIVAVNPNYYLVAPRQVTVGTPIAQVISATVPAVVASATPPAQVRRIAA